MSFTPPNVFSADTTIEAQELLQNTEAARFYVNNGIVQADIADHSIGFLKIAPGEYRPVDQSYVFVTGDVHGNATDRTITNRAYFTSTTKANNQAGANSVQFQDVYNTGQRIYIEERATVFVTFSGAFISTKNLSSTELNGWNDANENGEIDEGEQYAIYADHPGQGHWPSAILLRITNENTGVTEYHEQTLCYSFEEAGGVAALGTVEPGATGNVNRRFIQFQYMTTTLEPGYYQFTVAINPRVEQGFATARQFTLETFYT